MQQSTAPSKLTKAAAAAAQPIISGALDSDDETLSISSSLFRRDDHDRVGGRDGNGRSSAAGGAAARAIAEEKARCDARLDAQHRLRLMPAALWGKRAKHADAASAGGDGENEMETTMTTTEQQQQQEQQHERRVFLATGSAARTTPNAKHSQGRPKQDLNSSGGEGKGGRREEESHDAVTVVLGSSFGHHDNGVGGVGGGEFVLPVGAKFAEAASLKRPAVTASVPLRWQSRVVALSSLRDSLKVGVMRGSPSMGRRMAKTRCRAHIRRKKKR